MRALGCTALLLALLGGVAGAAPVLRFTASLNGRLEGCDCKVTPAAGLLKTAVYLRAEHESRRDLLVDGGDLLDGSPDADLAGAILDTTRELAYTAIAVGERDLESGALALLDARSRAPLLCNNLSVRDATGRWVAFTEAPLVVRRGARAVGILALLDPALVKVRDTRLTDPVERARVLVAELARRGADTILLLYHGSWEGALALVRAVPGIHVAVVAHENRLETGRIEGSTVLVSPGEAGSVVGSLDLGTRAATALAATSVTRRFDARFGAEDPAVRKRVDEYNRKLRERLTRPAAP